MCNQTQVGGASLGLQIAGTLASTIGAYNKSRADKAAYEYQAKVAENNAQLEDWRASDAITRGQSAEAMQRLKTAQLKGTQRASMAARGLDLTEGSPLNILTDTDYMGELDALTLRSNAEREAWGRRVEAENYRSNAGLLRARAGAENPAMAGMTTLLTGAGKVADTWYTLKNKGVFK